MKETKNNLTAKERVEKLNRLLIERGLEPVRPGEKTGCVIRIGGFKNNAFQNDDQEERLDNSSAVGYNENKEAG